MAEAGAILVSVGLTVRNPTATGILANENIPSRVLSITQNTAAPASVGGTQSVGTSEEALDIAGLTTLGIAWFENMDDTNFVQIGVKPSATFYPLLDVRAGEAFPVRLTDGVTPYVKADTAAVILKRVIHDD